MPRTTRQAVRSSIVSPFGRAGREVCPVGVARCLHRCGDDRVLARARLAGFERIPHRAILVAIGVNRGGQRRVLAVEMDDRERRSSRKELLLRLKQRGSSGVERVVCDDRAGLKNAIRGVLTEALRQRCHVHFLRDAPTTSGARRTKQSRAKHATAIGRATRLLRRCAARNDLGIFLHGSR